MSYLLLATADREKGGQYLSKEIQRDGQLCWTFEPNEAFVFDDKAILEGTINVVIQTTKIPLEYLYCEELK